MTQTASWSTEAWNKVQEKVKRTSQNIGAGFPHASVGGTYQLEAPSWWTAGFWPGLLWLLHREAPYDSFKQIAEKCEEQLDAVMMDYYRLDHDMGFMWTLTSVANYTLTGNEDSKRRGLLAANLLLGRFNSNGNFIRAWNPWSEGEKNEGWAIIDCLMNVPLLFWASSETGDPRFKIAAEKHADTALKHFIREDGSVRHIVRFDAETGEVAEYIGGQGHGPESAWSRGAAWALYGMALCYHHTGKEAYLHAAKRVAHCFIAHLPDDSVPHWDFRLPEDVPGNRDSSAGAIAASGLLFLAGKLSLIEKNIYREAGEKILRSLYENYGDWENPDEEGLILEGTSHFPEGKNTNNPLIYGDYYFVEGLAQLNGEKEVFWAPAKKKVLKG
ncbi:glycoside hydrolase family 88 protein [Domibacillus robiginosus]|uniref:glycoside hydrolase family 88 protein n=1 Tax=Domibacillus robiginosus TaxID=1071054 RepID=UPI00067B26B7|nr:glycoside hydrolase family 88 protein [Domibacillus robiginosus]